MNGKHKRTQSFQVKNQNLPQIGLLGQQVSHQKKESGLKLNQEDTS